MKTALLLFALLVQTPTPGQPVGVTVSGHVHIVTPTMRVPTISLIDGAYSTPPANIGRDGFFEFHNISAGTYSLFVNIGGIVKGPRVIVGSRDITSIEVSIPPIVRVPVTVNVENGGLLPKLVMQFVSKSGGIPSTSVSTGAPSVETLLNEGEYQVFCTSIPKGYFIKAMTSGSSDLLSMNLKVAADATQPVLVTLGTDIAAPWVRIRGKVEGNTDAANRPRQLIIAGGLAAGPLSAAIQSDGSFEIPAYCPEDYAVEFVPPISVGVPTLFVGYNDVSDWIIRIP
jgi:hypothetical protein